MEKHKCKLCFRSFSNGRALGGHMRSHMMNLPIPTKEESPEKLVDEEAAESAWSRSEEEEEEEDDDEKSVYYGLRENPKRSIKLVDPEFSLVILQDRESETESSKNPTRKRSHRTKKPDRVFNYDQNQIQYNNNNKAESWAEPEPVSSVSDATTEEDVAFCLMMMSRDNWKKRNRRGFEDEFEENDDEDDFEDEEEEESEFEERHAFKCPKSSGGRNKSYTCETCNKVFRSYQALGGHRASHKKIRLVPVVSSELNNELAKERESRNNSGGTTEKKVHQCPVCFRVFSSGQALGGHKRSHVIISPETTTKPATKTTTAIARPVAGRRSNDKSGESLIDLNLPAPDYEDDDCEDDNDEISQIELSVVSDAEFVNNTIIRQ